MSAGCSHNPRKRSAEISTDNANAIMKYQKKTVACNEKTNGDEKQQISLMALNDDCLLHIFGYIPLRQLIVLETVNKRMRSLCLTQWSSTRHLDFHKVFPWFEMGLNEFYKLLQRFGAALKSVDLTRVPLIFINKALCAIAEECHDVENLVLPVRNFDPQGMQQFYRKLHSFIIEDTELHSYPWLPNDLHFRVFGPTMYTTNLRILQLDSLASSLDLLLVQHPHLEELVCREHQQDDDYRSIKIGENKLKRLTLKEQSWEPDIFVTSILPQLTGLECFSMTSAGSWRKWQVPDLTKLKKLKELEMRHWPINEEQLVDIGRRLHGQLTRISLHGCDKIDSLDIARFMETQPYVSVNTMGQLNRFLLKLDDVAGDVLTIDIRIYVGSDRPFRFSCTDQERCELCDDSISDSSSYSWASDDDHEDNLEYDSDGL